MTRDATNLRIDAARLWDTVMETAQFGLTAKGGVRRLTLSDLDRTVREWFVAACREAGCAITIDDMGNIFARRPGKNPNLPPIAVGSHLDTQPTGGKFDGVIGVLSGLEILRTLNEAGYETNAPVEVINWTNEEGSRFAPAMLASGVFARKFTRDYAYARADREGKKFGDELARIGFRGEAPCGEHPLAAFFELHIEQGPILEAEEKTIGVVTDVQGMRWFEATVTGEDCHAGSTPMPMRKDALLGAARMISAINAIGVRHGPLAVATVGLIEARPNSRNVIPGETFFTIDIRHPEDAVLATMEAEIEVELKAIAADAGLELALARVWNSPPVHFDAACVAAVRDGASALGYAHRDIISGAGHDAAYVAHVAPTAMIFVPCERGVSHNELEKAEPEHVAAGADVLLRAVLATDARLAERAGA